MLHLLTLGKWCCPCKSIKSKSKRCNNMAGSAHWPVSTISDEWESGLADQQGEVGPKVEAGLNYPGSVHTRLQSLRLHFVKNTSFFFGSGQFEVNLNLLAI